MSAPTVPAPVADPVAEQVIDPAELWCGDCGESDCAEWRAETLAELRETPAVPLLVVGSAMYGRSQCPPRP